MSAPRLIVATLALGMAAAQAADEWDFATPHKNRCSTGTMLDMDRCLLEEYRKVDKHLNDLYQSLLKSLKSPASLREAQKAWIRFRDQDCAYSLSGIEPQGNLGFYAKNACLIDHTERRIRDMQRYIDWNGGAGSPPFKR